MAKVMLGLSNHVLSREENGVRFIGQDSGMKKIGELLISKGGVRWRSKSQKGEPHFATWKRFDKEMLKLPRR